ncbi:50S ribosomal protein L24 [Saprospira grandis]|uniref:Large ribosomal subunit protein uL24 n=1 Tax=Saprospira grandis (strain Lewin) TaxID=984262 RepID=H6L0N2_SAPGL|nr:50S ribosomal protein L24 [Saprospira grandis]AFC24568.1 50S ribosomal protein L24 [Saprospira grandis str. Lewin]WBM76007.1 50S ribosomal protein L24 [Saprospira grandis]
MANKKQTKVKLHVKVGDTVKVISGDEKGNTGKVVKTFPLEQRAIVEGLNKVKKHIRATNERAGGIIEKEASLHVSNLMLVDAEGVASKVKMEIQDGKKVRISKKTNQVI